MPEAITARRFVWYELLTTDPAAAVAFYPDLLGWGTEVFTGGGEPYTMWTTGGKSMGGTMKMPPDAAAPPHWLGYVGVDDIDATAARAAELGATTHVAPQDISNVGRFAVLSDPQGVAFAIYKSLNPQPPSAEGPAVGEVSWHELATTGAGAAWDFYSQLFGWQKTDDFDMGGGAMYQMWGYGGPSMGAVYNKMPEMPVPAWTYYVRVEGLDDKVTKVTARGGRVLNGPMEVPGGDRIAICADPQGAVFAMHERKSQ
jgi:hypothetical protein